MAIIKAIRTSNGYDATYHRVGGEVTINVDNNTVGFNMVGYKDADMRKENVDAVVMSTGLGFKLEKPLASYTAAEIYGLCYAAAKEQEAYAGGVDA